MKKPLNEIVSHNICRLLEELGETSVSAGRKSGMDQKTVWNMTQAASCNPTIKNIAKLSHGLRINPSVLLIDSAIDSGVPEREAVELIEKIVRMSPKARRQVAEFVEMWDRPLA